MSTTRDISFNEAMLASVKAGTKTQTRRLMRPQPVPASELGDEEYDGPPQYFVENGQVRTPARYGSWPVPCPYGEPGDLLRIQEEPSILLEIVSVRAERVQDINENDAIAEGLESWLEDMEVGYLRYYKDYQDKEGGWDKPELSFRSLWESIYGLESWNTNPWVWKVEFKSVQP